MEAGTPDWDLYDRVIAVKYEMRDGVDGLKR
jgi:hypothetical protein